VKIAAVDVFPLRAEIAEPFSASVAVETHTYRSIFLVRVRADEGVEGWGESRGSAKLLRAAVSALTPALLGQDPLLTRDRWQALRKSARDLGSIGARAMSALDMALWDLKGKALGRSVAELLGARPDGQFPAVATAIFYPPEKDAPERRSALAAQYVAQGFRAVKVKVGGLSPARDLAHVAAIRDAIGPQTMLAVDANCGYTWRTAVQVAPKLAEIGVHWFEEPLPLDDVAGYRAVAEAGAGLVVAGGQNLPTPEAFLPLLEARALHLAQPNVASVGGFTGLERAVAMAQAFGADYSPTGWGTGLLIAASLQMRAAARPERKAPFPELEWIEYDVTDNPLREAILSEAIRPENGLLRVPSGPGLGITVDLDALEHFRVE
jgi:D-galactarolactone cycloisomerase